MFLLLACIEAEKGEFALDGDGDGVAEADGDCDDTDAAVFPGADEHCDGLDNDCDGTADDDATEASAWYADLDGDGYGDADASVTACDPPDGYVSEGSGFDCDDADGAMHPGAPERCDEADQDCDGTADDDATDATTWYADLDGDGYGDDTTAVVACSGATLAGGDCDDTDGAVSPAGTDACDDGQDQDCDGVIDNGCGPGGVLYEGDADAAFVGTDAGDYAGSVLAAGDLDADGDADLVFGTSPYASARGSAWIAQAPFSGTIDLGAVVHVDASYTPEGVGTHVAVGDVDGDTYADLVVTTLGSDRAYLLLGPLVSDTSVSTYSTRWEGGGGGSLSGGLALGDLDGDGRTDVILGSTEVEGAGAVYVDYAPGSGTVDLDTSYDAEVLGASASDRLGHALASGEDVDGDGLDDLLVGGSGASTVYLFFGAPLGDVSAATADVTWTEANAGDDPGYAVALLPDEDDDGYADVLIGALYEDSGGDGAGAAYLLAGADATTSGPLSVATAKFRGEDAYDAAGRSVAGGDVDGDGLTDLLIGSDAHVAYLLFAPCSGTTDLSAADATFLGASDYAGQGVALVENAVTGLADVVVGAPWGDGGGGDSGEAWLFRGGGR